MPMFQLLQKLNLEGAFRYYLSVMLLIDGLDKFFNLIAYWPEYLAPIFPQLIGGHTTVLLYLLGIIEITIGVITWFSARWGGLLVGLLLFGIAFNLVIAGRYFNIVLVDIGLGIGALALAQANLPPEKRS
jgi:hypothetical protein